MTNNDNDSKSNLNFKEDINLYNCTFLLQRLQMRNSQKTILLCP